MRGLEVRWQPDVASPENGESLEKNKKLSPKQKKMASLGGNPNKIDATDLKILRGRRMR